MSENETQLKDELIKAAAIVGATYVVITGVKLGMGRIIKKWNGPTPQEDKK